MSIIELIKASMREFLVVDNHILLVRIVVISLFFSVAAILLNP